MKRMLVNANDPEEVRISLVEDGTLQELHVELADRESYLGNIYKGKVANIEPSIGAAFINFGGNRNGFLHASDVLPAYADSKVDLIDILCGKARASQEDSPDSVRAILDDELEPNSDSGKTRKSGSRKAAVLAEGEDGEAEAEEDDPAGKAAQPRGRSKESRRLRARLQIQDLLKKGQEVVVQITKEGIGAKGPTLTTFLSLPGRCLVLMPSLPKCGVSRKIDNDKERRRLKKIVRELDETGSGGIGFIVRTAGVDKSATDLERDLEYLKTLWSVVVQRAKATRAPAPLYVESDLVLRTMRDFFTHDIDEIIVDAEPVYNRVCDFVDKLMPRFKERVKHHDGHAPLFHTYGIEAAVESLFQPEVELSHGGSLVIEQTEALIAIDVNSGKFKPGANLEETAFKTNMESIPEIVRQLRLRDLGGVIIVDFIDMMEEKHRRTVERRFREALKTDRARINVGRISIFGMLELTRQRVGPGLKKTVFTVCSTCKGTSLVRTVQSKALAVLREIRGLARLPNFHRLEAYMHPEVCAFLENRKRNSLAEVEELFSREVHTIAEPSYPIDVVHYRFLDLGGKEKRIHIPPGLGVRT
ncbi:MAG: ribonuclease E/G [Planctomycetota bacterium]